MKHYQTHAYKSKTTIGSENELQNSDDISIFIVKFKMNLEQDGTNDDVLLLEKC